MSSGTKMPREWHRAYEKAYYSRPEIKAKRAAQMRAYSKNPVLRLKHEARWKVNRALANGLLIRQPCICGSFDTQAHHSDYYKPLEVQWLCRQCHNKEHAKAEGK